MDKTCTIHGLEPCSVCHPPETRIVTLAGGKYAFDLAHGKMVGARKNGQPLDFAFAAPSSLFVVALHRIAELERKVEELEKP